MLSAGTSSRGLLLPSVRPVAQALRALFLLMSTDAVASVEQIGVLYDAPYYNKTCPTYPYACDTRSSVSEAIDYWWDEYRKYWRVSPYGSLSCSYQLTTYPDGVTTGRFAGMLLQGQCSGGQGIFGNPYCPANYRLSTSPLACICDQYILTLVGGGDVTATEVLPDQGVRVIGCNGQPVADVPVEITAVPLDPVGGPVGELRPEGSNGAGSATISAFTDSNGEVRLEFVAPRQAGTHALTAWCTDSGKPCSPATAGPNTIRVHECPILLSIQRGGEVEQGATLRGQVVQVSQCGDPAADIPLQITTSPQVSSETTGSPIPENDSWGLCVPGATMTCTTDSSGKIEFGFVAPEAIKTLDVKHDIRVTCSDALKPCTPNTAGPLEVNVKGCPISLDLESGGTSVEPQGLRVGSGVTHGTLDGFVARATTCRGTPAAGLAVEISNTARHESGGHKHDEDDSPLRLGSFLLPLEASNACGPQPRPGAMRCATDGNGEVKFSFVAPAPAGIHDIKARCTDPDNPCQEAGPATVDVKVDGLVQIPPYSLYTLTEADGVSNVGDNGKHNGVNHYLMPDAVAALARLAYFYAYNFKDSNGNPPAPFAVNDASLPWGGLFDFQGTYAPPHAAHRRGSVVDIRARGGFGSVPPDPLTLQAFKDAANDQAMRARIHSLNTSNQHFHVELLGRDE